MRKHNLENEEYEQLEDNFYNDNIPSFSKIEDPKGKYYKEYNEKEQKILSDFYKYIENNNISPKDTRKEYKKQRIQQKLDTIKSRIQDRERNKNYQKGDMIDEIKKYDPNNENNKTHFIDKASFADLQEVINKVNALNAEKFYNSNDKDKIKQNKILKKLQQELKDNQNNKDLELSGRLRYALDDFLDPNRTKYSDLGDFELAKIFLDKVKKDRAERKTKILYAKNDKFNKNLNELQKQQKNLKGGDLEQSLNKEKDLINQNKRNINLTSRLNKNTLFPSANTKQLLEQVENKKKSLNSIQEDINNTKNIKELLIKEQVNLKQFNKDAKSKLSKNEFNYLSLIQDIQKNEEELKNNNARLNYTSRTAGIYPTLEQNKIKLNEENQQLKNKLTNYSETEKSKVHNYINNFNSNQLLNGLTNEQQNFINNVKKADFIHHGLLKTKDLNNLENEIKLIKKAIDEEKDPQLTKRTVFLNSSTAEIQKAWESLQDKSDKAYKRYKAQQQNIKQSKQNKYDDNYIQIANEKGLTPLFK